MSGKKKKREPAPMSAEDIAAKGWRVVQIGTQYHVVPHVDHQEHWHSAMCWCHPVQAQPEPGQLELAGSQVFTHNCALARPV